jgi:hypothetical protein
MPYLNLFLSSENDHIEHSCELLRKEIGLKRKEQTKALQLLLCNLKIYPSKELFVERRKKALATPRANPLGVGAKAIISSLDALHEHGYIVQEIGKWIHNKNTTIISTPRLNAWFDRHQWLNDNIEAINAQHITLRLNENVENKKVFVDYEDTDYSIWLHHELEKYTKLLNNSSIQLLDSSGDAVKEYSKLTITRGFIKHKSHPKNGEFLFGGRMSPPWVSLSSDDRKRIMINDEETIEIDRPASHINAMYEVIMGEPYSGGYPYDLLINDSLVPKHIVKNLSSFMQGAKSIAGTAISVGNHYKREANKQDASEQDKLNYNEWHRYKKRVNSSTLIKEFLKKHTDVRDSYLRGKQYGDMIQCWEADIVFEVVIELINRDIPVLTVYDSFIVQKRHKELLKRLMKEVKFVNRRKLVEVVI